MRWIDDVRGTDSIREVARKTGMNQGTLNRQINLDQLSFETVRAVARAYARPVVAALVATGHLSREDVGYSESVLAAASDDELVEEIAKRLRAAGATSAYDLPISELPSGVTPFAGRRNVGDTTQDLREVASESIRPSVETDADFDNA